MKSLKNLTGDSLEQLIDYNVVDQNGDEIGTLHSLWSDPDTGAVEFLGVKTGWLFGQNHVVPAGKAELDESTNVVRLPYTEDFIKEAPAISADAEISEEEESGIYSYYGMTRAEATGGTGGTTMGDLGAATGSPSVGAGDNYAGTSPLPETTAVSEFASPGSMDKGASILGAPAAGPSDRDDLGATAGGTGSRWRRTSRPSDPVQPTSGTMGSATTGSNTFGDPTTAPTAGEAVRAALDDLSPSDSSGGRVPTTPAAPGSYGTANLYGSTGSSTPVAADSLGTSLGGGYGGSGLRQGDDTDAPSAREAGSPNHDPITGEPGAHPVGTGIGALSGGAALAALGGAVVAGPVGAVVGGVIGAVGGGLAGKGVAESINPTEEDAYWQAHHQDAAYYDKDYEYSDYAPAYKTGYEGYGRYAESGRDYNEAEGDLKRDYEEAKGTGRLEWEKAKGATRDAWERLKAKTSDTAK